MPRQQYGADVYEGANFKGVVSAGVSSTAGARWDISTAVGIGTTTRTDAMEELSRDGTNILDNFLRVISEFLQVS